MYLIIYRKSADFGSNPLQNPGKFWELPVLGSKVREDLIHVLGYNEDFVSRFLHSSGDSLHIVTLQ